MRPSYKLVGTNRCGGHVRLVSPLAVVDSEIRCGLRGVAHEHPDRRPRFDSVVAQPLAEEGDHLRHQIDVRAGQRGRRSHVAPRTDQQLLLAAQVLRMCATCCCGSRRPIRRRSSSGTRSARSRDAPSRAASTARRAAPPSNAAATARARRFVPATLHATRRPRSPAPAAARSWGSCSGSSRPDRLPAALHPCSGRRRCTGRRLRRSHRSPRGRLGARRPTARS